ncbi:phage virion morphogenesis protein [uncultured Deefgea sp.]|uniref:phage virion morphogenesis protein n=1 Tax=uncultured Deefgea sp. TaxID=1304914 RepID=UPI002620E2A1|nr:phage virion morphogenesis protein [uncultured Deefgea sp.]
MFEVKIDSRELNEGLSRLMQASSDLTPVMRSIATALLSHTEANFAAGGRPKWTAKKDGSPATLQKSGQLAASITPSSGRDYAAIGTNKPYAAIHQFGGQTSPHVIRPKNKKALAFGGKVFKSVNHPGSKMPARPFLPVINGALQADAAEDVLDLIERHLQRALAK